VSNVWETRYRLLSERLEQLADRLTTEQPIATADLEEQTVRLLAAVVMLLRQHKLNKRGQCRFCTAPRRWRLWQRRPQCTVYRSLDFAMRQRPDAVWSRLLVDCKTQDFG
jgi:hypothetical protein